MQLNESAQVVLAERPAFRGRAVSRSKPVSSRRHAAGPGLSAVHAGIVASVRSKIHHGDSVLPLLLAALTALIFVASPLAGLGIVSRPLIGTTMVIVVLAGLFA